MIDAFLFLDENGVRLREENARNAITTARESNVHARCIQRPREMDTRDKREGKEDSGES